jgi:hypothetical protein
MGLVTPAARRVTIGWVVRGSRAMEMGWWTEDMMREGSDTEVGCCH